MKKSTILLSLLSLFSITNVAAAAKYNVKDIQALITQTYIIAIIFVVVFILIAVIISNLIKFQGGTNPKDPGKRRLWFWVLAVVAPISFYLYNLLMVIPNVKTGPALTKFSMHPAIASGIVLVAYIIVGFAIAKIMSRGKIGNWFPSKK